eukprot:CAMPEP_0181236682 /NCGR_PEP_ID=MMETSP1096-20121128/38321_1 /TAXON_ID=156174 ORGANISM="Chrysochromulina ericina, Strain CCMP281" /NCGR_SAMPLE_ID=MMETSP1096 /ASSEMBLY_ACC=CAM_ASM_000453 /LENGTH=117 /DNA_ID=CAMNT_0023331909 /DNA_START=99 /DNA_END=449 /DNA_ORIENTATION=+
MSLSHQPYLCLCMDMPPGMLKEAINVPASDATVEAEEQCILSAIDSDQHSGTERRSTRRHRKVISTAAWRGAMEKDQHGEGPRGDHRNVTTADCPLVGACTPPQRGPAPAGAAASTA